MFEKNLREKLVWGKKWTDLKNIHPCWQERSALQLVAVKQSTGNNVSGHYFYCYFLLFLLCFELSASVHAGAGQSVQGKEGRDLSTGPSRVGR